MDFVPCASLHAFPLSKADAPIAADEECAEPKEADQDTSGSSDFQNSAKLLRALAQRVLYSK
eukprot:2621245-Amphidinium_carterae.1